MERNDPHYGDEVTAEELPPEVEAAIDEHLQTVALRPHAIRMVVGENKPFRKGYDLFSVIKEPVKKAMLATYEQVGKPKLHAEMALGINVAVKEAFLVTGFKDEPIDYAGTAMTRGHQAVAGEQDIVETVDRALDVLGAWTEDLQNSMHDGISYRALVTVKWVWPEGGAEA